MAAPSPVLIAGEVVDDGAPVRFPSSELLHGAHIVKFVDLQASAMEVLSVGERKSRGRKEEREESGGGW